MSELRTLCMQRVEQFGAAGHADRIKPISLTEMAERYAADSPDPAVA